MALLANGVSHRIGHLGRDFFVLDSSAVLSPCEAEISVEIDGAVERWKVFLPKGLTEHETRVAFQPIKATAPALL